METAEIDPRLWYQRSQPRQEIQRLKEHMRRSIPVRRLESRERPAAAELKLVLRLADAGKLRVGAASGLPSAATQRLLAEQFASGDFYALEPAGHKPDPWGQTVGPLRAFAWPLLLQSGGLALRHGSRLTLTKSGRSALAREPAGLLSALWRKWLKGGLIDELRRIEAIKGQTARGRGLTQVRSRRECIAAALAGLRAPLRAGPRGRPAAVRNRGAPGRDGRRLAATAAGGRVM